MIHFIDSKHHIQGENYHKTNNLQEKMSFTVTLILTFIFSCHNLTSWDLWDDIFSIIKNGNENQTIPDEVSINKTGLSCSIECILEKIIIMKIRQKISNNGFLNLV